MYTLVSVALLAQPGLDTMAFLKNPTMVPSDVLIPFQEKGKYGYCSYDGERQYPARMTALYPHPLVNLRNARAYLIVEGDKVGLTGGNWVLKPRIQSIYSQGESHWFVYNKRKKAGWLDIRDGSFLTEQKYDDLYYLQDQLVLARVDNKYGLLKRSDMASKQVTELVPVTADSIWMTYLPANRIFCQYGEEVRTYSYDIAKKAITPTEVPATERVEDQRFHSPLWGREEVRKHLEYSDDVEEFSIGSEPEGNTNRLRTWPKHNYQDSTFALKVQRDLRRNGGLALIENVLGELPEMDAGKFYGMDFWKQGPVNDSISILYLPLKYEQPVYYFHRPEYRLMAVQRGLSLFFDNASEVDVLAVGQNGNLWKRFSLPPGTEALEPGVTSYDRIFIRFMEEDYLIAHNHNFFNYPDYIGRFKFPALIESARVVKDQRNGYLRISLNGENRDRILLPIQMGMMLTDPVLESGKEYKIRTTYWRADIDGMQRTPEVLLIAEVDAEGKILRYFRTDGGEIKPR